MARPLACSTCYGRFNSGAAAELPAQQFGTDRADAPAKAASPGPTKIEELAGNGSPPSTVASPAARPRWRAEKPRRGAQGAVTTPWILGIYLDVHPGRTRCMRHGLPH